MKIIAALLISSFSLPCFASLATFQVLPDQPIVMTADAIIGDRVLLAPWFQVRVRVTSNAAEPLSLSDFVANIDPTSATEPDVMYVNPLPFGTSVNPGQTYETTLYFDRLPATLHFVYEVSLEVSGGTAGGGTNLAEPVRFITQ